MQTLGSTGIRISELRFITVEALRTGSAVVDCKGKQRTVLIPKKLRKLLLSYCETAGIVSGPVFVTRRGNPVNRSNIRQELRARGDADGFGCLFFPERAICLAVFELGRTYRAMRECPQIDAAALTNAIYREFPDYAVKHILMEQAGATVRPDRRASPDWMISLTPGAGTAFLSF